MRRRSEPISATASGLHAAGTVQDDCSSQAVSPPRFSPLCRGDRTPDQLFAPDDVRWRTCTLARRRCSGKASHPPAAPLQRNAAGSGAAGRAGCGAAAQRTAVAAGLRPVTEITWLRWQANRLPLPAARWPLSTLAEEYPRDFAPHHRPAHLLQNAAPAYDITPTGNRVERGRFRFEEFILTPRRRTLTMVRTE